jgi:hypothetical protein
MTPANPPKSNPDVPESEVSQRHERGGRWFVRDAIEFHTRKAADAKGRNNDI